MKILITFIALMMFAGSAVADIPRPDTTPKKSAKTASIDTHLDIRLRRDAKEAKLILSKAQLNQLRAEIDAIDGGASDTASAGVTGIQTIAGGVLLSLAMVFAGVWFARSGRVSKPVATGLIVLAGGALATMVYANAGPPPEARSITGKMFVQGMHYYKFGGGAIKLEVSAEEDNPVLIVPDPEEPKKPGEE
ncbi:MAG TPA: hypothetical protein PLK77_13155 [Pyrinomonadaceae bacterium]|nr:hypothetical protein [Pyrinomonadaceae bacterium]